MLTDTRLDVGVYTLSNMKIIVITTPAIDLKLLVGVAYAVDVLTGVLTVLILVVDVVSAIDVDMLADENVNGLSAVMTSLENALSAPWE